MTKLGDVARICQYCGREYTPTAASQKYCSKRCNNRSYRERNIELMRARARDSYARHYAENKDRRNQRRMSGRCLSPDETKRPFLGFCEVCGLILDVKKDYHHWADVADLGVWLCFRCHVMAEQVDKGLVIAYLSVKDKVEKAYALKQLHKLRDLGISVDIPVELEESDG